MSDDDSDAKPGSDAEEDEEEEEGGDFAEEDDDDDDDEDRGASRKRAGSGGARRSGSGKQAKKRRYDSFIDEEAAEGGGDDDEDDDDDGEHRASAKELTEAEREAHERSRRRQEESAAMWEGRSVADIAAGIERRHKQAIRQYAPIGVSRVRSGSGGGGAAAAAGGAGDVDEDMEEEGEDYAPVPQDVAQQALIPSIHDPKLFLIECKTGSEQMLVLSLMNKAAMMAREGKTLGILSAVAPGIKGFIYLEAFTEPDVRKSISGMTKIYHSKLRMVPIRDMTAVLTVSAKKGTRPLREQQYVRMTRPPLYKDDLARVERVYDSGSKAVIVFVPRIDPSNIKAGEGRYVRGSARPPPRLFNAEEVKAAGGIVERKKFTGTNEWVDACGSSYFRGGFGIKSATVSTTLRSVDVKPTIEEVQFFKSRTEENRLALDDDDEGGSSSAKAQKDSQAETMEELALAREADEGRGGNEAPLFAKGDAVLVTEGEMLGLRGRVEEVIKKMGELLVKVRPSEAEIAHMLAEFKPSQLAKDVAMGAHVRVMDGVYTGETGTVVSLKASAGDNVAVVLTDRTAREIEVRTAQLQETEEIAAGLDSLQGFELYDLVQLGPTEMAVVVMVGREDLQVLTNVGEVKSVRPEEIRGKKNVVSSRSVALDVEQNQVRCGDVVNVLEGKHARHSGTVKHIHRSMLFLHSRSHQQHGGIFVARARSCVLSGNQRATQHALSNQYMGNISSGSGDAGGGGKNIVRDVRNRFDELLNKTVKLTKGQWKGLLGMVVEATETHVKVELSAKYKVITVERSRVKAVGDKDGALDQTGSAYAGSRTGDARGYSGDAGSWTPFQSAATPMHIGSQTPMHGSQTPMHDGSATPSHAPMTPSRDAWRPSAADITRSASPSSSSPYADRDGSGRSGTPGGGSSYSGWGDRDTDRGSVAGSSSGRGYDDSAWNSRDRRGSSSGGGSSSAADWAKRGMWVQIRSTQREGVVESTGRENRIGGGVTLELRMADGSRKSVSAEEVGTAPPARGDRVHVVKGEHRGAQGKCRSVDNNDIMVKLEGSNGSTLFSPDEITRLDDDRRR